MPACQWGCLLSRRGAARPATLQMQRAAAWPWPRTPATAEARVVRFSIRRCSRSSLALASCLVVVSFAWRTCNSISCCSSSSVRPPLPLTLLLLAAERAAIASAAAGGGEAAWLAASGEEPAKRRRVLRGLELKVGRFFPAGVPAGTPVHTTGEQVKAQGLCSHPPLAGLPSGINCSLPSCAILDLVPAHSSLHERGEVALMKRRPQYHVWNMRRTSAASLQPT